MRKQTKFLLFDMSMFLFVWITLGTLIGLTTLDPSTKMSLFGVFMYLYGTLVQSFFNDIYIRIGKE